MKKFIVALMALMFLLVVACGDSGTVQAKDTDDSLFSTVAFDGLTTVYRHNETGVCYMYRHGTNQAGLTVMLNPDGTPYVWEEDHE